MAAGHITGTVFVVTIQHHRSATVENPSLGRRIAGHAIMTIKMVSLIFSTVAAAAAREWVVSSWKLESSSTQTEGML